MAKVSEEKITKMILEWLVKNNWEIVSFDFPQSGTGKYLHPNEDIREKESKNLHAFIPDIVAVKDKKAVFFENKNRFFVDDFIKLQKIKLHNNYSNSIEKLLSNYQVENIYFGIGMLDDLKCVKKAKSYYDYVDFIVLSNETIFIEKDSNNIF